MAAVRAPTVESAPSFDQDVAALRTKYPEIDSAVSELMENLRSYWTIPHHPVDPATHPNIYAEKLDYPPLGAAGAGRFLATYYGSPLTTNPMQEPLHRFLLISLTDLAE
jgi:hypothetical protein